MAPKKESSTKNRVTWTPELTQKLFVSLLHIVPSNSIDYAQLAEMIGEGNTSKTVYKRIYDLKSKSNLSVPPPSTTATTTADDDKPKPKKRKRVSNTDNADNTA